MAIDVDGLFRRFGSIIVHHLCVAAFLHKMDMSKLPIAYIHSIAAVLEETQVLPSQIDAYVSIPILTSSEIASCSTININDSDNAVPPLFTHEKQQIYECIHSVPILLNYAPSICSSYTVEGDNTTPNTVLQVANASICTCLCVAHIVGSFLSWSRYG